MFAPTGSLSSEGGPFAYPQLAMSMQNPAQPTADGLHLWQSLLISLATGVLGVLGTIVTFRTRLALQDASIKQVNVDMNREHTAIRSEIKDLTDDTEKRHQENQKAFADALARVDRKMDAILRISVALARKQGADHRFPDDVLVQLLGGDEEPKS